MDVFYHIGMLVIIGIFFFINSLMKPNTSLLIVILLCLFGFGFLILEPVEYVDDTTVTKINGSWTVEKTDITETGLGGTTYYYVLWLAYFFFFIIAILGLWYDDNGGE